MTFCGRRLLSAGMNRRKGLTVAMKDLKTAIKDGTRDFIFGECELKRTISDRYLSLFRKWGYDEIMTPEVEFLNVFSGGSVDGMVRIEDIYKLTDEKNRLLALRADCTMPIARVVASKLEHYPAPYRLCYDQKVFSASAMQMEASQCGVELIGAEDIRADVEILTLAVKSQKVFFDGNFRIELGHGKLFGILVEEFGIDPQTAAKAREFIEKKNFAAIQAMDLPEQIKMLPRMFGDVSVLQTYSSMVSNSRVDEILAYLKKIYEILSESGLGDCLCFDLGLVHSLDYYTGIIFRGYVSGSGQTMLSGGRYDNLLANYGKPFAAVGFGIYIEHAFDILKAEYSEKSVPDYLIYYESGCHLQALEFAEEADKTGKTVLFFSGDSPDQALREAKQRGIRDICYLTKNSRRIENV